MEQQLTLPFEQEDAIAARLSSKNRNEIRSAWVRVIEAYLDELDDKEGDPKNDER